MMCRLDLILLRNKASIWPKFLYFFYSSYRSGKNLIYISLFKVSYKVLKSYVQNFSIVSGFNSAAQL